MDHQNNIRDKVQGNNDHYYQFETQDPNRDRTVSIVIITDIVLN